MSEEPVGREAEPPPPLWRFFLRFAVLRALFLSLLGLVVLVLVILPRVGLVSIQGGLLLTLSLAYGWFAWSKAIELRRQELEGRDDERLPGRYRRN